MLTLMEYGWLIVFSSAVRHSAESTNVFSPVNRGETPCSQTPSHWDSFCFFHTSIPWLGGSLRFAEMQSADLAMSPLNVHRSSE